jgi:hypothetical protein
MNWAEFDSKRRLVATFGRFSVYYDPLVHLPWGLFRVYAGDKYIGAQISYPIESDCRWLAQQRNGRIVYATHSYESDNRRLQYMRGATSGAKLRWRKDQAAA